MLAWAIVAALFAPPEGAAPDAGPDLEEAREPASKGDARLELGPGLEGPGRILDDSGELRVQLEFEPGQTHRIALPPGRYRLELPGQEAESLELGAGETEQRKGELPTPSVPAPVVAPKGPPKEAAPSARPPEPDADADEAYAQRNRRRKAAGSLLIPGLGQMLMGQGPKGAGIFVGTLGLVAATAFASRPPADPSLRSPLREGARLGGFGIASGALMSLWAGQAMDAFTVARGRPAKAIANYRLRVELNRSFSLRFGPRPESVDYLRDWSLSILGQPARRVVVGASDLGFHDDGAFGGLTLQAGIRAGYRVLERDRLWLTTSGGVIGQLTVADNPRESSEELGPQSPRRIGGSGTFYAQLEMQWFLADRWSLNFTPRFWVPVGSRRFGRGYAVPTGSPSFELGTGVGVQF